MQPSRSYSKLTHEALALLGKQIRLARKRLRWSEHELAERVGVSRSTVQKIEKGDPGCAVGLVFEAAVLVGVGLFDASDAGLGTQLSRFDDKLALLPKAQRSSRPVIDDDF